MIFFQLSLNLSPLIPNRNQVTEFHRYLILKKKQLPFCNRSDDTCNVLSSPTVETYLAQPFVFLAMPCFGCSFLFFLLCHALDSLLFFFLCHALDSPFPCYVILWITIFVLFFVMSWFCFFSLILASQPRFSVTVLWWQRILCLRHRDQLLLSYSFLLLSNSWNAQYILPPDGNVTDNLGLTCQCQAKSW